MINVGEQLVASYLQYIRGCEFTQQNLYTTGSQGEIDVVGINLKENKVYVCEVAIHLTTGLQYVKDKRPNNIQKLTDKFSRDIEYANEHLSGYEKTFMLWSPVVKDKGGEQYNQLSHLNEVGSIINEKFGIGIELVVNERFSDCLQELRSYALSRTAELKCPVLRFLQIEEHLRRHLAKGTNH
jgi:Holliday junction resolvase-like predicted endonuclease